MNMSITQIENTASPESDLPVFKVAYNTFGQSQSMTQYDCATIKYDVRVYRIEAADVTCG